jgi:hypothetical protein
MIQKGDRVRRNPAMYDGQPDSLWLGEEGTVLSVKHSRLFGVTIALVQWRHVPTEIEVGRLQKIDERAPAEDRRTGARMRLTRQQSDDLRGWGEHDEPLPAARVESLAALGLVRVLHLKCEPDPIRMLTTAGFEERDRLRKKARAR